MASPALAALSAAPPSDRHLPLIGPINTPHKHSALEGQGECAERERGGKRIRKWWQKDKKAIEVREEGNVGEKGGRTKEKTRHHS